MQLDWASRAGVHFLHVPQWTKSGTIHGFCGADVDSRNELARCEEIGAAICGVDQAHLYLLKQTHSINIVSVPVISDTRPEADAWFLNANIGGGIYGIETADCAPVLLRTRDKQFSAALHCGWRGTCAGILNRMFDLFFAAGVHASDLEMAIGPCAGVCCYEVGEDFILTLAHDWGDSGLLSVNGKFHFDLRVLLTKQALARGLGNGSIIAAKECTICDNRFFSFRRQKLDAGRQLSFISSILLS